MAEDEVRVRLPVEDAFVDVGAPEGTSVSAAAVVTVEYIAGTLPDGTQWRVAKPTPWNGTLILDLDGFGTASPTR